MSLEEIKLELIRLILETEDIELLKKIRTVLNNHNQVKEPSIPYNAKKEKIVAYTVNGKALNEKEYLEMLDNISKDVERGNFTTQENLEQEIKKWE